MTTNILILTLIWLYDICYLLSCKIQTFFWTMFLDNVIDHVIDKDSRITRTTIRTSVSWCTNLRISLLLLYSSLYSAVKIYFSKSFFLFLISCFANLKCHSYPSPSREHCKWCLNVVLPLLFLQFFWDPDEPSGIFSGQGRFYEMTALW